MAFSPPISAWLLAKNRRRRIADTLTVSATPITTATVGVAYAGFTVAASGGQGSAYRFAIHSGSLPPGMSIDQWSGDVSGMPTEDGAFGAVISAADEAGNLAFLAPFTITVAA